MTKHSRANTVSAVRFARSALVTVTAILVAAVATSVVAAPDVIEDGAVATRQADRGEAFQTSPPPPPPQPDIAGYVVTLNIEWSAASHPATVPPNSHISPPVVVGHGNAGDLFAVGTIASPGIEGMAERGVTSTLRNELDANDSVTSVQVGSSLFGAGQQRYTVTLSKPRDMISLVTMLAPSPDWFVGVAGADLFVDGVWLDQLTVDLDNYDAGTDSASDFIHVNVDTRPARHISGPRDAAFAFAVAEGRFGTVTFTRLL